MGRRSAFARSPLRPGSPAGTLRAGRRPASHKEPLLEVSVLVSAGRVLRAKALPPGSRSCWIQLSLRHRPGW